MLLSISLTAAAALALLHIWQSLRVSHVRRKQRIELGDGGSELLHRRMRAHSNFTENAPFFLALLALLELARVSTPFLWGATILFVLARLAHMFGMERKAPNALRMGGAGVTWLVLIGLAGWAITLTYARMAEAPDRRQTPTVKA